MTKSLATPHEQIALKVIDTWLDYRIRHTNVPGVQVCIRKKGEIIFSKAYGVANTKTARPLKTTDLFHIASHSKMFTTCCLLMLQEKGLLNLEDKVMSYVPELKKHKDKRFQKITIQDLLLNRAGIFRDGLDALFWQIQKPFLNRKQLLDELLSTDLTFAPQKHTKYSNIGFSLLGIVIENITGQSYAEAVSELILKKIKNKHLLPDYTLKSGYSFADGHSRIFLNKPHQPLKHVAANAMAPATGFCGNAEATSLFLYEYLLGSALVSKKNQKLLKKLSFLVHNSKTESYGLGLQVDKMDKHMIIGHSGGYPGYVTQTRYFTGTDYVISVFVHAPEIMTMNVMKFCVYLFKKMNSLFKQEKVQDINASPSMLTSGGGSLYVAAKNNALRLASDTWQPIDTALELKRKGRNLYFAKNENGYDFSGEARSFFYDKNKKIKLVKSGGVSIFTEKEFLTKKLKNMLA